MSKKLKDQIAHELESRGLEVTSTASKPRARRSPEEIRAGKLLDLAKMDLKDAKIHSAEAQALFIQQVDHIAIAGIQSESDAIKFIDENKISLADTANDWIKIRRRELVLEMNIKNGTVA